MSHASKLSLLASILPPTDDTSDNAIAVVGRSRDNSSSRGHADKP
jgi:hypothetical protein